MPNIANDENTSAAPVLPPTVTPEMLKSAFRRHAAGVSIITASGEGGPLALTVSSLTSVSADPAVVLCSIASTTETGRELTRADSAVIHLLTVADRALAGRCSTPGVERFPLDGGSPDGWELLPTGEPVFTGPRVLLRGEIVQRTMLGEATVLMLAVTDVIERTEGPAGTAGALAYLDRRWHALDDRSALP